MPSSPLKQGYKHWSGQRAIRAFHSRRRGPKSWANELKFPQKLSMASSLSSEEEEEEQRNCAPRPQLCHQTAGGRGQAAPDRFKNSAAAAAARVRHAALDVHLLPRLHRFIMKMDAFLLYKFTQFPRHTYIRFCS